MKKLSLKKALLTIFAANFLGACGSMPKVHPHVLDTQLKEMREYEVVDPDTATVKFKETHPMNWGSDSYGNGFWCVPPQEAAALKEWYLEGRNKKARGGDAPWGH